MAPGAAKLSAARPDRISRIRWLSKANWPGIVVATALRLTMLKRLAHYAHNDGSTARRRFGVMPGQSCHARRNSHQLDRASDVPLARGKKPLVER